MNALRLLVNLVFFLLFSFLCDFAIRGHNWGNAASFGLAAILFAMFAAVEGGKPSHGR